MRYTEDPSFLILPTEATIKHIAKREGLDELSEPEWDFVWDLLAKAEGAQVAEFDEAAAQVEAATHAMLEAEAFMQRYPDADQYYVTASFEREYHHWQHQLHDALEQVDLNEIPGYNHPVKAVRIVKLLRRLQQLWVLRQIEIGLDYDSNFVAVVAQMIIGAIERVEGLTKSDLAMLKTFAPATGDNPDDDAKFLALELQLGGMNLDELMRIARHLDDLSEFQRGKSRPISDPEGEEVRLRDIEELGELGRVSQQAYALPDRLRMKKAVTGELGVREPQTRRNKKQLLYLVVDGSSSMIWDGATSASRAAGVVLNRLQAVVDGDAEVHVRFFNDDLREQEYYAKDVASARELMRIVTDPTQYAGGTRFDTTLAKASRRIQELVAAQNLREPELVFITDGDATVPDVSVLNGIKMHVVQVGPAEVERLSELAHTSGGINVYAGLSFDDEME
jgi:Mg-chelatase subunit ChlD